MILPESRSLTWIEETAKNNNAKDITLVEKTIRAFSLLEALARSGMEFCFKGLCVAIHKPFQIAGQPFFTSISSRE